MTDDQKADSDDDLLKSPAAKTKSPGETSGKPGAVEMTALKSAGPPGEKKDSGDDSDDDLLGPSPPQKAGAPTSVYPTLARTPEDSDDDLLGPATGPGAAMSAPETATTADLQPKVFAKEDSD